MMAKPMKSLELHYPMVQFFIILIMILDGFLFACFLLIFFLPIVNLVSCTDDLSVTWALQWTMHY